MTISRRKVLQLAAVSGAAGVHTAFASDQAYPNKPVTIVVSYPAGGDTDAVARLFAERLAPRLGQPVIVDNRPGASGTIGNAFVGKAPPDGHLLLLTPSTFSSAPSVMKAGSGAAYDGVSGFTPIVQTGHVPLFLVTNPQSGFTSLKDVLAAARSGKPLAYASPGNGSPMHFVGEMLNKAAGVQILHSPYRGVAPAVADVLGGHVPLAWVPYGPVAQYVATGKLLALAVGQPQRSSLWPNVPSLGELGYPNIDPLGWQGVFGPKGLPQDIIQTLNRHFNEILKSPDVVTRLANFGTVVVGGEPEQLARSNVEAHSRYAQLVQEFGIQAE